MLYLTLLWAVAHFLAGPSDDPQKAALTITIQNVQSKTGTVRIALMKGCKKFPDCNPENTAIIDAKSSPFQKAFSVEPGDYAVAVYHDKNANGELDKRIFGIPKEPYGFSNNFRPRMSAPTFGDCKITVGSGGKTIQIRIE
ncbi:MAG: DUF2141 domain-containing protein [Rudanella sp.]|nr:DUF2141 domain-containing protein [Rudanella sp.]